jgi:hypothetical protein
MADLETMTDEQQQAVLRLASSSHITNTEAEALVQAIRAVRSLGDAIARAHKILSESRLVDSPQARLAHDLRAALGGSDAPPDDDNLSSKRETEEEGNTP